MLLTRPSQFNELYSKFTLFKKLERKEPVLVIAATIKKMKDLSQKVEIIAFDNGKEFASRPSLSFALNVCYYLAALSLQVLSALSLRFEASPS